MTFLTVTHFSINGTSVYEKYKGWLIAIGVDANDGLYPLAFVVVESEPEDFWRWFLQCIYYLIPSVHNNRTITVISDKMKKLTKALANEWPLPHHHHYYLRHIQANLKKIKDVELDNLFFEAGCAANPLVYKKKKKRNKVSLRSFT